MCVRQHSAAETLGSHGVHPSGGWGVGGKAECNKKANNIFKS